MLKILENKIVKNFVSLSIFQVGNLLFPLITFPYVVSVIGVANFGESSFMFAIISFLVIIADFGLDIYGVREVSVLKSDRKYLNQFISGVVVFKIAIAFVILLIFSLGVFIMTDFPVDVRLFVLSYSILIGNILFPQWVFLGLEEMKHIAILGIVNKVIYFILIIVFIKTPEDYLYVNLLNGIALIAVSPISFMILSSKYGFYFSLPNFDKILDLARNSRHLFLSNLSVKINSTSGMIILGFFSNFQLVGIFSIADRIIQLSKQVLIVYFKVIHPHVCGLYENSRSEIKKFFLSTFVYFAIFFLVGLIIIKVTLPYILPFLVQENINEISILVSFYLIAPAITLFNIPFSIYLLASKNNKAYGKILSASTLVGIPIMLFLTWKYNYWGIVVSSILTEILILLSLSFYVYKLLKPSFK